MATAVKKKADVEEPKGKKPDWVIRARQEEGSDFYVTLGSGWTRKNDAGQEFISLKFNTVPSAGLSSALLMRPLPPKEE